ncbi:MAG: winged helix-turn-helix domain-containing protein [Acidimicrobiales bacterium]
MRRLRRRVEVDPHHPRYIRSVRGYGYIIDL